MTMIAMKLFTNIVLTPSFMKVVFFLCSVLLVVVLTSMKIGDWWLVLGWLLITWDTCIRQSDQSTDVLRPDHSPCMRESVISCVRPGHAASSNLMWQQSDWYQELYSYIALKCNQLHHQGDFSTHRDEGKAESCVLGWGQSWNLMELAQLRL